MFGKYGKKSAIGLSAFYSALQLLSNTIALLPINVKQDSEGKKAIVKDHEVTKMFYSTRLTKFNLFKQLVCDIVLKGNAYLLIKKDGNKKSLVYVPASSVAATYDYFKDTVTYQVTNPQTDTKRIYKEDEILHFFMYSSNGWSGVSLLTSGSRVIEAANAVNSKAQTYYENGCAINGILAFNGRVTDEQKAKIRSSWQQVHGGEDGSGLAIIEGDTKFTAVNSDGMSSQLNESRNFTILEIARLFNIDPILLGVQASNQVDIEQLQTKFISHCVLPWVAMFCEEIDRKLHLNDANEYFDFDETALLKSKRVDMANYLRTLTSGGIISLNEAREIIDFNAREGADELIIPYNDTSISKVDNEHTEEN